MRELRVRQPWADLAYASDGQKLEDILNRVQMLEARIRELEMRLSEQEHLAHEPAAPVSVSREAVPV